MRTFSQSVQPTTHPSPARRDAGVPDESERPLRIAVVLYNAKLTGARKKKIQLANGLASRGFSVELVFVRAKGPLLQAVSPAVRVVELEGRAIRWAIALRRASSVGSGAAIPSLAAYLRRSAPDVVMAGNNPACFLTEVAHRLARAPGTRSVLSITNHLSGSGNSGPATKRRVLQRVLGWADALVAVGDDVARDLEQTIPGIAARVHTIHNPIIPDDLDALQAEPAPHPWFEDGGAPVVISCGRLEAQKDFSTLLRAFSLAREKTAARLVLIGDGRERDALQDLAASLGIERDVVFLGRIENPFAAMARADLFVLSSVWEGLPNVLVEAMACGCAVVSTDAPGGARDVLRNGTLGPLTPPGDPHALAAAILDVLAEPPDRATLEARGREFSVAKSIDGYADLFRTLVRS